MTPSDQNDILHAVDSQAKIFSKRKPEIDMPDYPSSKIASGNSILTLSWERKR